MEIVAMIRLFTALSLPDAVRSRLAMLQSGVPGARWIRPENLHVTLRFIGEVDQHVAADLDAELARTVAPGFDLSLDGVGHFGPARKPTSLWAGIGRSAALPFLHDKIDRALVAAGLRSEEHTSEIQTLMRISYAVFRLKKKYIQLRYYFIYMIEQRGLCNIY